jgi:polysaccharide pyruvyl transferase CsaB
MPDVLLSGYYGFGNVGDDALCQALVDGLLAAGASRVLIPTVDAAKLPARPEVVPLGRYDLRAIDDALRGGAVLFSGGGGLLQNVTSSRSLLYYLAITALARRRKRPYVLGFQSIGPLRGRLPRALAGACARRAAAVSVRDRLSASTLRDLGVPAERVTVGADAAFLLAPPTEAEIAAVEVPPGPNIAMCLRDSAHVETVLAAVRQWDPAGLVLIACQAPDHVLHQRLAATLSHAPTLLAPCGVRGTLAALGACDAVISERLHPLVFAALAGVPAAAIAYDPKVAGLAADLGLPVAGTDAGLAAAGLKAARSELVARGGAEKQRLRELAAAARETALAELARLAAALGM